MIALYLFVLGCTSPSIKTDKQSKDDALMDKKTDAIQSDISKEIKVHLADSKPTKIKGYTFTVRNISYEHLINGGNASLCTLKVERGKEHLILELEREHSNAIVFLSAFDLQIGLESVSAYNQQSADVILKPKTKNKED